LKHTKISAFCSTRWAKNSAEEDKNLLAVIESKAKAVSMFGKTWIDQIEKQLKITPEENLECIKDSVEFLKSHGLEVFYDAEHFFDGYKDNSSYAKECIKTAFNAGADVVVFCETNGGCLPAEIKEIVSDMIKTFPNGKFGIHCHNDSGCAVANSLICAENLVQIQGTMNGFGERTGNADLCQIIPGLVLKKKINISFELKKLKYVSDMCYVITNTKQNKSQPYVGDNAFAHKGGMHVDAISKGAIYEHINPELIGNKRNIVLSDLSGAANVVEMLKEFNINVNKNDQKVRDMLLEIKDMEKQGYPIGDFEAEKYLIMCKHFKPEEKMLSLNVKSWKLISGLKDGKDFSECLVNAKLNNKEYEADSFDDNGPVSAIYNALQKIIASDFENANILELDDYKVTIVDADGTKSSVMVYINFKFKDDKNNTKYFGITGISRNIIEASLEAIQKGFEYYLIRFQ
jgi:2-isopropylmalate synthase